MRVAGEASPEHASILPTFRNEIRPGSETFGERAPGPLGVGQRDRYVALRGQKLEPVAAHSADLERPDAGLVGGLEELVHPLGRDPQDDPARALAEQAALPGAAAQLDQRVEVSLNTEAGG